MQFHQNWHQILAFSWNLPKKETFIYSCFIEFLVSSCHMNEIVYLWISCIQKDILWASLKTTFINTGSYISSWKSPCIRGITPNIRGDTPDIRGTTPNIRGIKKKNFGFWRKKQLEKLKKIFFNYILNTDFQQNF